MDEIHEKYSFGNWFSFYRFYQITKIFMLLMILGIHISQCYEYWKNMILLITGQLDLKVLYSKINRFEHFNLSQNDTILSFISRQILLSSRIILVSACASRGAGWALAPLEFPGSSNITYFYHFEIWEFSWFFSTLPPFTLTPYAGADIYIDLFLFFYQIGSIKRAIANANRQTYPDAIFLQNKIISSPFHH